MNTSLRTVAIALAIGGAAIAVWFLSQPGPSVDDLAPAIAPSAPRQAEAVAEPAWFVPTEPAAEPAVEDAAVESPAAGVDTEPSADPTALTAETLKDTRWKDDNVDVVFMADGRWQMNGRICAKWEVEGSRVKIFDDKGEVHYVDIVGDNIEFNGKKIGRAEG